MSYLTKFRNDWVKIVNFLITTSKLFLKLPIVYLNFIYIAILVRHIPEYTCPEKFLHIPNVVNVFVTIVHRDIVCIN